MGADEDADLPHCKPQHSGLSEPEDSSRPKRRLRLCFLILGMGGISFSAAILQSGDYLNRQYDFQPGLGSVALRTFFMVYNFAFLVMAAAIFFGGPKFWPDKKTRMLHSYVAFLVALAGAALVEGIVNQAALPGREYAFCVWVAASVAAGAADALAGSVLNGEAAACKCNYYATYGRTGCSFLLLGLRSISKALLPAAPGELGKLRLSASMHIAVAVALQLACVLIIVFALPVLVRQVEAAEDPVVPTGLNFQQTIITAYSAMDGGTKGQQAAASLAATASLAPMLPGMDSTYGLPILQAARTHGSQRMQFSLASSKPAQSLLRNVSTMATAQPGQVLPTTGLPYHKAQSMLQRSMSKHHPSFLTRRSRALRSSMVARAVAAPAGESAQHKLAAAGFRGASFRGSMRLSEAFSVSGRHAAPAHAPSLRQRLFSIKSADEGETQNGEVPVSPVSSGAVGRGSQALDSSSSSSKLLSAAAVNEGMSIQLDSQQQPDQAAVPGADPDLHTPEQPQSSLCERLNRLESLQQKATAHGKDADDAADAVEDQDQPVLAAALGLHMSTAELQSCRAHPLVCPSIKHSDTLIKPDFDHLRSIRESSYYNDDGDLGPSPFHSLQMTSDISNSSLDDGTAEVTLRETLSTWWSVFKKTIAYQLLVCIGPLITGQMLPIAHTKASNATALGSLYPQVVMFAQLLGSLIGSQLMPMFVGAGSGEVIDLVHPRRTLYGMFAGSLMFIPAFALALHFSGPPALIVLVFLLFTYGGYCNSLVFTLANRHMVVEDSCIAQLSMVLTAAFSFFIGSCLQWMWLRIKL